MAACDRTAERTTVAHKVRLADELLERARAHAGGERLALGRRSEEGFGSGAGDGTPRGHQGTRVAVRG